MLSSRIPSDSDDNEEEPTMPGDYEPMRSAAARIAPPTTSSPTRPTAPPMSKRRPRPTSVSPTRRTARRRQPTKQTSSLSRSHRSRRRSLTPNIVIDRRHRRHESSRRGRVIRIPLDNRPTLGLRGPPKRILELERVRCRRPRYCHRRKHCSLGYEDEQNNISQQLPSNVIIANPIPNPCAPSNNNQNALLKFLSNLNPQMMENLPKHTVRLPPIHLPGSQADNNTELHTVVFPAELINPIDGTLSIIQATPGVNGVNPGMINNSLSILGPTQPQRIGIPTNGTATIPNYVATASDPFLQQLQDLVQRVTLSQAQSTLPASNPTMFQPPLSNIPQSNTSLISRMNSANIRPTNIPNSTPTYPPISTTNTESTRPYRPANITPYRLPNNRSFQSPSHIQNRPSGVTPYRPPNQTTFQPRRAPPSPTSDVGPYRPANITPVNATPNRSIASSMLSSATPSRMTPSISSPYSGSSNTFNPYSYSLGDSSLNVSTPSQSQTPYRSDNPMPRSILRNGMSNAQMNTTYSRLNPSSVSSTHGNARKRTTFA
ncbi:hypothetical protein I4U23_018456 [Adineta vaga]|nr:hypothetical protein I4U23_018456 [Adineta vaga]